MLSLEDCLDFSELDADEVAAIAEHEHIPMICAAEMGYELLASEAGLRRLHQMLRDDIRHANESGDAERAGRWAKAYSHLRSTHPVQPVADPGVAVV